MAAANFRGTRRELYTPKTVKYLEPSAARKDYQALRRVFMKRQDRLEKAGIDNEITSYDLPPSSTLDDEQIISGLLDVSRMLRNPLSMTAPAREQQKYLDDLRKKAEKEDKDLRYYSERNKSKFGKFMNEVKRRAGGKQYDSATTRQIYEEALSRGMQPKTLLKHFGEYLQDNQRQLEAAINAYRSTSSSRLTINALKELLY